MGVCNINVMAGAWGDRFSGRKQHFGAAGEGYVYSKSEIRAFVADRNQGKPEDKQWKLANKRPIRRNCQIGG